MNQRQALPSPKARRATVGVAGILLVSVALLVTRVVGGSEPTLTGTQLDGRLAPDFTLTDYRGQTVSLGDFRGHAVALTFIYTHCPDVCPLVAENLRVAYELLPEKTRASVSLLAVTVDPARDTQQALQEFTAIHRLTDNPNWFALRGDPAMLREIWRNFGIYPGASPATASSIDADQESYTPHGGGDGHTDGIYFIDPEGREQVFLRSSAMPQEIADNLAALLE